jgi:hypothetical protein
MAPNGFQDRLRFAIPTPPLFRSRAALKEDSKLCRHRATNSALERASRRRLQSIAEHAGLGEAHRSRGPLWWHE